MNYIKRMLVNLEIDQPFGCAEPRSPTTNMRLRQSDHFT